jgi:hypothetical protein
VKRSFSNLVGRLFQPVTFGDTLVNDAFGAIRTSQKDNRSDIEWIYDKQVDLTDEVTNGTGTVTHNGNPRDLTLAVGGTVNGAEAAMYSYPNPYTAGNSQLIELTGVPNVTGADLASVEVFLRSNITGTVRDSLDSVPSTSWDIDATGRDWTDSHIFGVDLQSLKVGRIRFFMVIDGLPTTIAQITNDNVRDSGYWQLPMLPAYYRVYNTATNTIVEFGYGDEENGVGFRWTMDGVISAGACKSICLTVKSESGGDLLSLPGLPRVFSHTTSNTTVGTAYTHVMSVRPKSTFQTFNNLGLAIPKSFEVYTDNPIYLELIYGHTIAGASWTSADLGFLTSSMMEGTVTTGALTLTNARKLDAFYIGAGRNTITIGKDQLAKNPLWYRRGAESGIYGFRAIRNGTRNALVQMKIHWDEIR